MEKNELKNDNTPRRISRLSMMSQRSNKRSKESLIDNSNDLLPVIDNKEVVDNINNIDNIDKNIDDRKNIKFKESVNVEINVPFTNINVKPIEINKNPNNQIKASPIMKKRLYNTYDYSKNNTDLIHSNNKQDQNINKIKVQYNSNAFKHMNERGSHHIDVEKVPQNNEFNLSPKHDNTPNVKGINRQFLTENRNDKKKETETNLIELKDVEKTNNNIGIFCNEDKEVKYIILILEQLV